MSSAKYIVIAIVTLTSAAVLALPSMELLVAMNQNICKTEVFYNEDPNRIPKVIKELKCSSNSRELYQMCSKNGRSVACCGGLQVVSGAQYECAEVHDAVRVSYTNKQQFTHLRVAVGCLCIKQDSNQATE